MPETSLPQGQAHKGTIRSFYFLNLHSKNLFEISKISIEHFRWLVCQSLFCLGCSLEELLSLTGQVSGKNIIRTNLMLGRNDLKKQCTTT